MAAMSTPAVLARALVLNELCTNAVKYGAITNHAGCVEIDAKIDGARDDINVSHSQQEPALPGGLNSSMAIDKTAPILVVVQFLCSSLLAPRVSRPA
jgi:two-component sensor histidine kinase